MVGLCAQAQEPQGVGQLEPQGLERQGRQQGGDRQQGRHGGLGRVVQLLLRCQWLLPPLTQVGQPQGGPQGQADEGGRHGQPRREGPDRRRGLPGL
ncbi:MAG: hypothetical protein U5L74_09465 [Ideonella sp.]|nr:hypothetical protein [Ideonella sp.]